MKIYFKDFGIKLKRLQKCITNKKYWRNNNMDGQQNKFVDYFSLKNWEKLSNEEKREHTLEDCKRCNTTYITYSSLHLSSSSLSTAKLEQAARTIMDIVSSRLSRSFVNRLYRERDYLLNIDPDDYSDSKLRNPLLEKFIGDATVDHNPTAEYHVVDSGSNRGKRKLVYTDGFNFTVKFNGLIQMVVYKPAQDRETLSVLCGPLKW
ncbi:unnamed protein product [Mytilus coruscus]|uniref:Uncharacterized protein n=1 Tax=Mytilus coruscus TaxID=42192 RepID=A0A6J8EVB8_MYTCO|nr:unnamed protein product [Mytilus coruscus]